VSVWVALSLLNFEARSTEHGARSTEHGGAWAGFTSCPVPARIYAHGPAPGPARRGPLCSE
jgi:hypothetical protein